MRFIDHFPRSTAWTLFLAGLAALLVTDHMLRIRDGQVCNGGLPETIYYGTAVILGLLSFALLWRGLKKWRRSWFRSLEALGHLVLGLLVYVAALLFYVVGTGIDSL